MDLANEYRPTDFSQVVGQDSVVNSLQALLESDDPPHSYLFHGPSGTGKTTLGRLLAHAFGCDPTNVLEIDGATNSGVEDMRAVASNARYVGLGESPVKVVVVDECHAISKKAFDSLLKIIEEPPSHLFWVFCTTEFSKVPKTIRTRCAVYEISRVSTDDLFGILDEVSQAEGMNVDSQILDLVASSADGSPRQALSGLAAVRACDDRAEAAKVLRTVVEEGDIVDLCRYLVKGGTSWSKLMQLVAPLEDMGAESARRVIVRYFTAVARGAKSTDKAMTALAILDEFAEPYTYDDNAGLEKLIVSLGHLVAE